VCNRQTKRGLAAMTKPEFVSVVIPTHNRPDMLREAVASVRAQTFTDYEIIVVCNGSTPEDLAKYVAIPDIRLLVTNRKGIGLALNIGIEAARGEWVAFLDDDDLWEPNKLKIQLQVADSAHAEVVFCDTVNFGNGHKTIAPIRPPPSLSTREAFLLANYGGGCSATMVRRSALLAVGGFDESHVSPDWDLWMRLSWHFKITWADAFLVRYRYHEGNASKKLWAAKWRLKIIAKAFMTAPADLQHMRLAILTREIKTLFTPIYVFANALSFGWLSYFKREMLKWR
jgi:glycosyltransferase involved in cell wall biosynthesis